MLLGNAVDLKPKENRISANIKAHWIQPKNGQSFAGNEMRFRHLFNRESGWVRFERLDIAITRASRGWFPVALNAFGYGCIQTDPGNLIKIKQWRPTKASMVYWISNMQSINYWNFHLECAKFECLKIYFECRERMNGFAKQNFPFRFSICLIH